MKNAWLIAGLIVGCTAGASLGACGSSSGTSGTGTAGSVSSPTSSSVASTGTGGTVGTSTGGSVGTSTGGSVGTSTGGSVATGGSVGTSTGGAGGAECSTVTSLHPPHPDAGPGSIYCPFSAVADGGNEYCTPGTEHCCETPEGAATMSACQPIGNACTQGSGYTDWQCEDPGTDCTTALPVCCAAGASIGLGTPGCGNFSHDMKGTACVAAGSCTGIILCTSSAECPAATPKCTPFGKAGNQVGGCTTM
jgi:hypothetical protein